MQQFYLKTTKQIFFITLLAITFLACNKDEGFSPEAKSVVEIGHNTALRWNQLYLDIERYCPGYKPPVSARNYAYINLIAYESIVHGTDSEYNSFSGYFDDLFIRTPSVRDEYNWEVVLNSAYEKAFELYFPTAPSEQQFRMLEVGSSLRSNLQSVTDFDVFQRSVSHGEYVAETIYEWSKQDSWGHEGYLNNNDPNYVPPTKIDYWKPTYPDYTPALLPHWGKVRTFAATSQDDIPAPEFSVDINSKMYNEAKQTMELVNEIKDNKNEEEYWIAEFWSDDCPILTFSPAGRMVSITNQLIAIERLNMMETVATYAKLGMALSDAGVKCWGYKYKYNLLRPIDYIREFMGDPDWNTVMCPDGSGGFYTPNFPTYPSGHATFSAAASIVLEDVFGKTYHFTDRSHEGRTEFRGAPRSFTTFREMAYENAYSRVPLGVHFAADSEAGSNLGFALGGRVVDLPWQ